MCNPDPQLREKHLEYARVTGARIRLETAERALAAAKAEVSVTVGEQHDATQSVIAALQALRIALAKLDIVVRAVGRTT